MRRFIIMFLVLLLAPMTLAGNSVTKTEWVDNNTYWVDCLGLYVTYSVVGRDIIKFFNDGSGKPHYMQNTNWAGHAFVEGSDMSWKVKGGGPLIWNFNPNNLHEHLTIERHEVLIANGDYPNLHWRFTDSFTINANGELVVSRFIDSVYTCIPN